MNVEDTDEAALLLTSIITMVKGGHYLLQHIGPDIGNQNDLEKQLHESFQNCKTAA